MRETDKFRSDLERAARGRGGAGASNDSLRSFFFRSFPRVGEEAKSALFASYLERRRKSEEKAADWLAGVGSVLLMDYDGADFTEDDWRELRDAVALEEDGLDIDLLEYVMSLVLDHGAM
jgi:hypothetical protein